MRAPSNSQTVGSGGTCSQATVPAPANMPAAKCVGTIMGCTGASASGCGSTLGWAWRSQAQLVRDVVGVLVAPAREVDQDVGIRGQGGCHTHGPGHGVGAFERGDDAFD